MKNKNRFNIGYDEMNAMPNGKEKAIQYAVSGLLVDGEHHKQWCFEQVLEALGEDLKDIKKNLAELDYGFEEGIAP